jgi:hypothetical protein
LLSATPHDARERTFLQRLCVVIEASGCLWRRGDEVTPDDRLVLWLSTVPLLMAVLCLSA